MVKLIIITILVFSLFSQSNVFCANLNDKVFFHFGRYLDDDIIIQEKHLPRNLKLRAAEYRKRYLSFKSKRQSRKSKLQSGAPSNKEDDAFMKMIAEGDLETKQDIEKSIYSLINDEGINSAAADFVNKIELCYEWEGFSDCPISEAKDATEILLKNPKTPAKPYILLYVNYRYLHALRALDYELKELEEDTSNFKINRKRYKEIKTKLSFYFKDIRSQFSQ
jgi:hypothetical protein